MVGVGKIHIVPGPVFNRQDVLEDAGTCSHIGTLDSPNR